MISQPKPFDPQRSRAVLIGCHDYPLSPGLDNLPSVPHSLDAISDLLQSWGLPNRNCERLSSQSRLLQPNDVLMALESTAAQSPEQMDLFLVYFSGHGYYLGEQGLHLALSQTTSVEGKIGSLAFRDVAHTLQDTKFPADHVIVILDCCHAGAAIDHVRAELQQPGTVEKIALLVAADKDELARSPVEDGPSFFTNALVRAVTKLAPQEKSYLSLDTLGFLIKEQAEEHNRNVGLVDFDKHAPAPLLSPGGIRHMPWLPNLAPRPVAVTRGPESAQDSSQAGAAGGTDAPPTVAHEDSAPDARPARQEPPAPMGLRWPWDYRRTGRPVLPRPKQFTMLQDRSRSGAVVPVTGEPGVGKKFLTEIFLGAPDGVCAALPQDPYVLRLDLDLIRYNSPVPALRALQLALGVTRGHTANLELTTAHFAEARERAVAELALRAGGRPLVLYITLRATRTDLRKVYEDLELLVAYPLFRDALVLLISARNAGGVTGGGQLMPAAAVPIPGLERGQAAELIRQLLDERGITGPDPEEALRLAGDDTMTLRPVVLMQAAAALAARTSLVNDEPDSAYLGKEIRRATHYVIEPVLIESGCQLREGAEPGALAILLAWVQLGAPPLVVDELPVALKPLQGVVMWLRASGVLVDSIPGGSPLEVTVGSVAQDALREIRRRLQFSPHDRYGENRVPDVVLGAAQVDEVEVDRLIGKASAELLAHMHQFGAPPSPELVDTPADDGQRTTDKFQTVGALERALNELDELELPELSRSGFAEWSETRSILSTHLLAQSVDTPFLPVDLKESQAGLGRLQSGSPIHTRGTFPPFQLGIAQLNVFSRLPGHTPGLRENLSEVLRHLQEEFHRMPGIGHTEINTLDRLTLLCARQLDAADKVCEFRIYVLDRLALDFSLDFSSGRVSRVFALAGWGLQTMQLTDDHDLLRRIAGSVGKLLDSLEDSIKASPSDGLTRLFHQLHLLEARVGDAPEKKARHLVEAVRIEADSAQVGMRQQLEKTLEAVVGQETAAATLGCLLKDLLIYDPQSPAVGLTPVTRWRVASQAMNSLISTRSSVLGHERLAVLGDVQASGALVPGSDRDEWVFKTFLLMASVLDKESLGMHQEVLRDLHEVKAGLDRSLDDSQDWMVLRSWLTVTTTLSQRVWSETLRDAAGPALARWTAAVRQAADKREPDTWSILVGQQLLGEADSPLVLRGPCPLAPLPGSEGEREPELEQKLRAVHADRQVSVQSFAESYGPSNTWFRAHHSLERRFLHELASITGRGIPTRAFRQIYSATEGRQPPPQYEFLTIMAKDAMADWNFSAAAKRADPRRKAMPEYKRRELLLLRADALLREGLWMNCPGPQRSRLLETAHRELAESPKSAPGRWGEVLRLRAACAFSPSPDPLLTGIPAELDNLLASAEQTGFLQLAAALTDLGEGVAEGERGSYSAALTDLGATIETVQQLGLFHLEQAERLCGLVPLAWKSQSSGHPRLPLPSTGENEERIRNRLVRAWACLNGAVWLNPGSWESRAALALDQGRVLALAHLIWGEDASQVLELDQGYTGSCAALGCTLLGFAADHTASHGRLTAKRFIRAFGTDEPSYFGLS
ncbi:caspase family protein [Streptomyces sp. PKU-MA01144]|uniref:caspase family protein n=1 Tax=Streptomyces sp. PKU-MA01144 TaxID=2729138 RepID=UPI0014799EDD|nr:caspase family protein [Streptomyces sp. PKU-MA01144]NNJ04412.1 caspase family protein [Streptomyces sp. PKU-MA01144]